MKSPFGRSERRSLTFFKMCGRLVVGAIIIAIQVLIYYLLIFHTSNIPYITVISVIFCLIVVSHIYSSDNNISYKLTWTVICVLFNLTGPLFYLTVGNGNTLPKRKNKKIKAYLNNKLPDTYATMEKLKTEDPIGYKHARSLNFSTDGYGLYDNVPNTFFKDGEQMYLDMLEKLKNAKKYIFLEFFIIAEGSLFDEVFGILKERAANGVDVRVIYDAVGSGSVLSKRTINELNRKFNVRMVSYNPLGGRHNLTINYRDHRKILVVDGIYAYTGGMNLADEYVHRKEKFGFWRDNGMLIEGKACYSYVLLFAQNWYMSTKEMLLIEDYKPFYNEEKANGYIFPFGDGPNTRKSPAYDLFLSMINNAQKSIYIATPYFVIDTNFISAIAQAIKSGIEVKVLIPKISDKKMFFPVTLSHFKNIILNGGEVYKYDPGFNHAKNIIVDGKYAFIGTVNLDYRSLFLHFECGNLAIGTDTVKEMEDDFLDAISKSTKIEVEEWKKRPFTGKVMSFICTIFGPLL